MKINAGTALKMFDEKFEQLYGKDAVPVPEAGDKAVAVLNNCVMILTRNGDMSLTAEFIGDMPIEINASLNMYE